MMKRKSRLKFLVVMCFTVLQIVEQCRCDRNCTSNKNENLHGRNAFSPRMDFNQWKPLGRGDPLKNDPTYDYVPPVLDQVHYWMEPAKRKPDAPLPEDSKKTEILLLGVLSKKPATPPQKADSRIDSYHKKEPKYNPHQRIAKPTFSFFPESLFNTLSKFTNTEPKQNFPYTVLMPPPMNYKKPKVEMSNYPGYSTSTTNFIPSSSPHVTIQPSHLIYQSSSISDEKEWKNKNQYATVGSTTSWKTSTSKPYVLTTKNYRENLVFNKNLQPPESFIHIEFSPTNYSLIGADSNYNLNYVTPPSLKTDKLHKGSISDNSAELQNTYVKIEKPEFYSTADDFSINTAPLIEIFTHMQHPVDNIKNQKQPVKDPEMETIKNMQTLLPPPTTDRPVYKEVSHNPILNALLKEKQKTTHKTTMQFVSQTPTVVVRSTTDIPQTTATREVETTTNTVYVTETDPTTYVTTTLSPITTPTTTTVDPIYQYFKKPEETLKNPVYFVIQGHSKVKTYGPTKQVHGISVQETNEIFDDEKSPYKVKHLHTFRKDNKEDFNPRLGRSKNVDTLEQVVQTGVGSIGEEFNNKNRRKDVKETILHFGYNVADDGETTSEKYHKGIVEEARKLKI